MSNGKNGEMDGFVDHKNEEIEGAKNKLAMAKKELLAAENAWEDDDFIEALKQKSPEEKEKAIGLKQEIGTKILMLENAQISLVVSRVKENSKELESAITNLEEALEKLDKVTRILNAVASLLSIVGRILAL